MVFVGSGEAPPGAGTPSAFPGALAAVPGFSLGLMSATEGVFRREQMLLDIGQGARVQYNAYDPSRPPPLRLLSDGHRGRWQGWAGVLRRARGAPALLAPGLLASSIPGLGAYAGETGESALAATARDGTLSALSLGAPGSVRAQVATLLDDHRLVVADLAAGPVGWRDLRDLAARRPAGELLIAVQRVADRPGGELLWTAAAGLGAGRELTSSTTQQRGLIASTDLAVTALRHLGLPVPGSMRGRALSTDGGLDVSALATLRSRLLLVSGRRLPALAWLAAIWSLLLGLAAAVHRARIALRWIGLSALWLPVGGLLAATLNLGAGGEIATLVTVSVALAALTDLALPWPRGPLAPGVVVPAVLVADALAHTQLLIRSLLGPNPAFGARFYGIGNELKSALVVLVLSAAAARLHPGRRCTRSAVTMAAAGAVLAVVEGSARLGAGVGGVVLVAAGAGLSGVMLLPGELNRRRLLLLVLAPLVALGALAALDLLTAPGVGHFNASVLHARSLGDLRDLVSRRYQDAWDASRNGLLPWAVIAAVAATVAALRRPHLALGRLGEDPVWRAALSGGLAAGVAGALSEDSGAVLFVVAVFTLACLTAYLRGAPNGAPPQRTAATLASARAGPSARALGAQQ